MRKLAAIMFTDIVGYTALMGEDEAKALRLLQKNRGLLKPIIEQFRGEWLKEMGDGTLSAFGSAVDAVDCALQIQQIFRGDSELILRIGIHLGDVVFEEGDVFGDGVNIASRIEPLAEPGSVCVSEQVYEAIRNKPGIAATFLGDKKLKGVDHPVKVYAVTEIRAPLAKQARAALQPLGRRWWKWAGAAAVMAVIGLVIWSGGIAEKHAPVWEPTLGPKSIAVLPFANLSDSKEDEYFSDGVTDDIITHLAKIGDLKVISRTSAILYKDSPKSLQVIAAELGVSNILEGSVRRHGNRVRITGQLIDARTDEHLWAETYDRELTDIFAIQSEVARNIAVALKAILSPEEKERIEQPPTASIEAYDLYLKGRSLFYTYEKSKNEEAIVMFRKAIDLDPSFSLGYAGLSLCYSQYRNSGWDDDEKWVVLAENTAKKAIALDSYSAEAHFALGFVYERRGAYDEMEREMRKVIELNQNHAHAHNSMGDVAHRVRGQLEDAVREYRLSLMIDPFLLPSYWQNAEVEIKQGRYRAAEEILLRAQEFHENSDNTMILLGRVYLLQGEYERAAELLQNALALNPTRIPAHFHLGLNYALQNKFTEARAESDIIADIINMPEEKYLSYLYLMGWISLEQGNWQVALEYFTQALKVKEPEKSSSNPLASHQDVRNGFAETYLRQGNFGKAIEQYARMDHAPIGNVRVDYMWAKRHYKLGVAYEKIGDPVHAKKEYETFLELWKDADDYLPEVLDAKARLAEYEGQ